MKSFLELGSDIHQAAETANQIEEIVEAVEPVEALKQDVKAMQTREEQLNRIYPNEQSVHSVINVTGESSILDKRKEVATLRKIPVDNSIPNRAQKAWRETLELTGSPAEALRAAKLVHSGNTRLSFRPHQGEKERLRRQKQLAKQQEKANG